jgi:hypothetical protein
MIWIMYGFVFLGISHVTMDRIFRWRKGEIDNGDFRLSIVLLSVSWLVSVLSIVFWFMY